MDRREETEAALAAWEWWDSFRVELVIARHVKGWSQRRLAVETGTHQGNLGVVECGIRRTVLMPRFSIWLDALDLVPEGVNDLGHVLAFPAWGPKSGRVLREIREFHHLTRPELAAAMGVHLSTLEQLENAGARVRVTTWAAALYALGYTPRTSPLTYPKQKESV